MFWKFTRFKFDRGRNRYFVKIQIVASSGPKRDYLWVVHVTSYV